jgi:serine O-acetyltransferase
MWPTLLQSLRADLYRVAAQTGFRPFCRTFLCVSTYRYMALFRICQTLGHHPALKWSLYPFFLLWFARLGHHLGIRIPLSCTVGDGLLIEHWGGIWVNPAVRFGRNCNIAHGVTLGWVGSGTQRGAPELGDAVFLGPGCAVLGGVSVGNHALISANSVVLQDVPENGVVLGVPGRVFSTRGSHDLVKNLWSGSTRGLHS